jgi:serine/threonine protein kinase/Tol biopolymer transport system component
MNPIARPWAAATQFGPYEIVAPIGAGGMGEVYRAWDPRLGRAVAIKVLPAALVADAARLARFEQEARIIASLSDANVLSMYDVGTVDATPYIVTELLEGETLRTRITRGVNTSAALDIAAQLASGLCTVHNAGIVHRDLKPDNVFITRQGVVKILDFGLALPSVAAPVAALDALTIDVSTPVGAETGAGTAAYRSPEQTQGLPADHRSDLFALGAILFEVLTGLRAFARDTAAQTADAVLTADPFDAIPEAKRPAAWLAVIVDHCLDKDPAARFQSARDLLFTLRCSQPPSAAPAAPPPGGSRLLRPAITWAAGAIALFALSAIWNPVRSKEGRDSQVTRSALVLGDRMPYAGDGIAVSRDGSRVVWTAIGDGQRELYVRRMDDLEPQRLSGTKGATGPFFSYDGRWIGFFADGRLKKVPLDGGPPLVICEARGNNGGSWGADDTILFTPSISAGLWRVAASGGTPQMVTTPDATTNEKSHRFPEWLPGGRAVLFHTHFSNIASLDDARIELLRIDTGERRVLVDGGQDAHYVSTGHIVYLHGDSLMAIPFDLDRLAITGTATPVASGMLPSAWGARHFAVSANGLFVYVPGHEPILGRKLVWVDREGGVEPISDAANAFLEPQLSADGTRAAVRVAAANDQVWIYEFQRKVWTRLAYQWDTISPVWTPDSRRITVGWSRNGPYNLFWMPANDGAAIMRLLTSERPQRPTSWSPDGRVLAFTETGATTADDIWTWHVSEEAPRVFLRTSFAEGDARFSPDGRWIVYTSNESGRPEIYVRPFPGPGGLWRISADGGQWPVWARSGQKIYYRTPLGSSDPNRMVSVSVSTGQTFSAATPHPLFDARAFGRFDVTPDGRRFLMISSPQQPPRQLHVVTNWFAELTRKAPSSVE